MRRGTALSVALLLIVSVVGATAIAGATTASGSQSSADAYAGAHVDFEVDGDAITDYRVDGDRTFSSVAVQSRSDADLGAGLGVDLELDAVAGLEGAGLSMAAESEASAQVRADSGATLEAHDTQRGTLVVEAGGEGQYVEAELAAGTDAEREGDGAVRVETDGQTGTFLVVGEGEVTVNEEGNVVADLEGDATLAFRSYEDGERDDAAEYEESLIAGGQAAAEVHVEDRTEGIASSAVTYGEETTAEVSADAENRVEMTVERTHGEGTVVITTVSEEAVGSLEDLEVTVDGEAAVEASSESELEGALGGDRSAYKVAQHAEAQGEATVYVAFNHFSERTATIESDDSDTTADETDDSTSEESDEETDESEEGTDADESGDETDTDGSSDGADADGDGDETDDGSDAGDDSIPGFGPLVPLVALSLATALGLRR
ncbi:hypothetical protein [Halopiger goleimassiliensis]|uniref:hypothetical protein n=1 Tax=Halopiger goleimassiliensis TaxID=1293048 RepID=UPI000677C47D|nr:hypothetical protein [Halopiger goleimassiliensis]